nr:hypothetical protein [Empedobacter falsenii]
MYHDKSHRQLPIKHLSVPAEILDLPLKRIEAVAPGRPEPLVIRKPASLPCNKFVIFGDFVSTKSFALTTETAVVTSSLRCVEYPVTTAVPKSTTFSS